MVKTKAKPKAKRPTTKPQCDKTAAATPTYYTWGEALEAMYQDFQAVDAINTVEFLQAARSAVKELFGNYYRFDYAEIETRYSSGPGLLQIVVHGDKITAEVERFLNREFPRLRYQLINDDGKFRRHFGE